MHRVFAIAAFAAVASTASAQEITSTADAFNAGKTFANSGKEGASGAVNSTTASSNLPYYSTSAPQSEYFQDGTNPIGAAGSQKQAECQTSQASSAFNQQECDAINFLTQNPTTRPKYNIDRKTDPLLNASQGIIDNPGPIPATSTQQCRVEQKPNPVPTTYETCVEADTIESVQCSRILVVACDPERDGCDQGGIVANSWAGDMKAAITPDSQGNLMLTFGTIGDNYWGSGQYDRTLSFEIRDLSLISRFALTRAKFDDWLWVQVNGTTVYVGPYGGDMINRKAFGRLYGVQCRSWEPNYRCGNVELGTSWDSTMDVDLRPYLVEGSNTIWTRTIVGGGGESAIQITTRQVCPRDCHDQWDDSQCSAMAARSQQ